MTTRQHFTFITLDTRAASRAATLALLAERPTLGIEVTDAALAAACGLGNIDPQHGFDRCPLLPEPAAPCACGSDVCYQHASPPMLDDWLPGRAFPTGYIAEGRMSAIDVACGCRLPPEGAVLATVRPDMDSVGAMAVLVLRSLGLLDFDRDVFGSNATWRRVCDISSADNFRPGPWARRPILTQGRLWSEAEHMEPVDGRRSIAHLAAVCSPRPRQQSYALGVRVAVVACWLLGGEAMDLRPSGSSDPDYDEALVVRAISKACDVGAQAGDTTLTREAVVSILDEARATVEASRRALAEELAQPGAKSVPRVPCPLCTPAGESVGFGGACPKCSTCGTVEGTVAIVRVSHAGALGAGYCLAPVVIAFDRANPGKVTIAAAEDGHVDFIRLRATLQLAENEAARAAGFAGAQSWGGPHNLLGSPQGDGTRLSEETIVQAVRAATVTQ